MAIDYVMVSGGGCMSVADDKSLAIVNDHLVLLVAAGYEPHPVYVFMFLVAQDSCVAFGNGLQSPQNAAVHIDVPNVPKYNGIQADLLTRSALTVTYLVLLQLQPLIACLYLIPHQTVIHSKAHQVLC